MGSRVLVTGADGYLGQRSVEHLLRTTAVDLVLWLRARTSTEMETKKSRLRRITSNPDWARRISFACGDLREGNPFESLKADAASISHILHAAAVIRFNVESELAQTVNVDGARKILEFAASLPKLKRLGTLSSLYAAGLQQGALLETSWSSEAGFANHYEESKWQAENILVKEYSKLPFHVYRVSTAIADDESGTVSQWNAVHNSLKLLYYGLISLMPGDKGTSLYFVTGRYAAAAMTDLLLNEKANHSFYHISSDFSSSIKLQSLVETAFEAFRESDDFRERRILPPLYADWKNFEMLSTTMSGMGGEMLTQALAAMTPFARQLYSKKEVSTLCLQEDWNGFQSLDVQGIVKRMCQYIVKTKFGREVPETEKTENFYAY